MNLGCRFVTARRRADPATPFHPIFALPLCWHYSRLGWKICFILVVSFWWKKNTHANKSQIRIIPLHWKLASKAQLVQHHQTSWCLLFFFFFLPFFLPIPTQVSTLPPCWAWVCTTNQLRWYVWQESSHFFHLNLQVELARQEVEKERWECRARARRCSSWEWLCRSTELNHSSLLKAMINYWLRFLGDGISKLLFKNLILFI